MPAGRVAKLYVTYIIKKPIVFYLFLILGTTLFLYASFSVKMDVRTSFTASINGRSLLLDSGRKPVTDTVWIYYNKEERVYRLQINSFYKEPYGMRLEVDNPTHLSGRLTAEIVTKKQPLFERIFLKAGKGS